ncbi:MAG: CaiB/BaiF CoA-transferase family protein [Pseudomonadota bacterium]|nr:CaiB/BaiF CoA-transferase family protein [Pseudomonadota bacterium]
MPPAKPGPLAGLKVIELAHIMAGPCCGLMLANMGANVIKVEKSPKGDDTRSFTPPDIGGEAASFLMVNRGKRGIVANLKTEGGLDLVRRLLAGADVVIENYRKGTMERLGLGYETLREANSGLIYCEISGFGRTGPYADRAGFDLVAQGMSGLMSITGEGPGRPPIKVGAPVSDITAGVLGAMGVLAAVYERQTSGKGQRVDTSLFEAGIMHTFWQSAIYMASGEVAGPMGSAHPLNAPYQAFETADGWINVGSANQTNWLKMLDAVGAPELAHDPRFADNEARARNRDTLAGELTTIFRQHPKNYWLACLDEAGVPAGPVLDIAEVHADPQAIARGMISEAPHSTLGTVKTLGSPLLFSETPSTITRGAPILGEHTREVLAEHGYSDDEIDQLICDGAVMVA